MNGSSFIRNHDLGSPASVRRGLEALMNIGLIYREEKKYFVKEIFLSLWLKRS
ncbi:MAG: hypothetical protein JW861_10345 [Bacteroidales bacterium]|nr:hypothetical protein [Bacteroidales bacterium]